MKNKSKVFKLFIAGAMSTIMLASCGGTTEKTPTPDKPAETKQGETTAEKPADVKEIIFTNWAHSGEMEVHQKAVDAFNEKNPDIKVTYQPAPGEGYEEQLITALAGGKTGADVFYAGDSTIAKLVQNGTAAPLKEFMNSAESYAKPEEFADGLWGGARKDGEIYGITVDCNPVLLYYSPAKFKELGIKDPREYFDAGQWNFENFDATLTSLKEKNIKGLIFNKEPMYSYVFALNNGGKIWQEGQFKPDEKAIEAFEYLAKGIKEEKMIYASSLPKGQGSDSSFLSGQVGFVTVGRWFTPMFNEAKIDFDYIPFPTNLEDKYANAFIGTAYMAVNSKSEKIEESKKFASFFTSKDGQSIRLGGIGNAIPSVSGIDEIVTSSNVPVNVADIFKLREKGWANGSEQVQDALYAGLMDALISQFEEIYINGKEVKDIIPKMEEIAAGFVNK